MLLKKRRLKFLPFETAAELPVFCCNFMGSSVAQMSIWGSSIANEDFESLIGHLL